MVWFRPTGKIFVIFPLLKSCKKSWSILKNINPKVVVGFGGHVTVPIGIVSRLQKRKLLIHEQNIIPGKANRLLSLFANKVMVGLPTIFGGKKAIVTGNPIREKLIISSGSDNNKKKQLATPMKVLVLGGSNGSESMNDIVVDAFSSLGQDFEIWHQTGKKSLEKIKEKYNKFHKDVYVEDFIDDMANAYAWADVVISRSGAITIAELLAFGKPSILIPNPRCANNHQVQNALYMVDNGVASFSLENNPNITTEISGRLMYWLSNPLEYYQICAKAKKLSDPDSATKITDICVATHNDGNLNEVYD